MYTHIVRTLFYSKFHYFFMHNVWMVILIVNVALVFPIHYWVCTMCPCNSLPSLSHTHTHTHTHTHRYQYLCDPNISNSCCDFLLVSLSITADTLHNISCISWLEYPWTDDGRSTCNTKPPPPPVSLGFISIILCLVNSDNSIRSSSNMLRVLKSSSMVGYWLKAAPANNTTSIICHDTNCNTVHWKIFATQNFVYFTFLLLSWKLIF